MTSFKKYLIGLAGSFLLLLNTVDAQKETALYDGAIPNSIPSAENEVNKDGVLSKVSRPTLTSFLPEKGHATGTSVIICPGGGYSVLVIQKEGFNIARYYQQHGIAAFVLKYRLPDEAIMRDKSTGPLQDVQQAIKSVRMHAKEWGLDPQRVGIMGFSAGGHLASTASTHFNEAVVANDQKINLRPDFAVLVYPVISLSDSLAHKGSRKNLLGEDPSNEKVRLFSNELQVTARTPPTFLIHSTFDDVVDVDNSIVYFEALRRNKVPVEMHIYPKGNHGFVLNWPIDDWMSLCLKWMEGI